MSNAPRFIHLRLHSEYSLLEGAVPVKKLIKILLANTRQRQTGGRLSHKLIKLRSNKSTHLYWIVGFEISRSRGDEDLIGDAH